MKFPGDGMVKTLPFHCPGPRFNPWSGNYDPTSTKAKNQTNNQTRNHPKQKQQQKTSFFFFFCENLDSSRNLYQIWVIETDVDRNRNNGSKGEIKWKNKAGAFFFSVECGNKNSESHSRLPVLGGGWRYAGCQRSGPSAPCSSVVLVESWGKKPCCSDHPLSSPP